MHLSIQTKDEVHISYRVKYQVISYGLGKTYSGYSARQFGEISAIRVARGVKVGYRKVLRRRRHCHYGAQESKIHHCKVTFPHYINSPKQFGDSGRYQNFQDWPVRPNSSSGRQSSTCHLLHHYQYCLINRHLNYHHLCHSPCITTFYCRPSYPA